jgi:hypothetical protein
MEEKISAWLTSCSETDFGEVRLSDEQQKFCHQWSDESILHYKSLPQSTQTEATLFFAKYAKTSINEFNLFRMYYVPAWSIIYWLIQSNPDGNGLTAEDIQHAKTAHFMAMFLHALDDHLNDHQVAVTHLTLLLRSQSWMLMNRSLNSLAAKVDGGQRLASRLIDDYYASIENSKSIASLDSYCDLFRQQMATWQIVPSLMTRRLSDNEEFSVAIQRAYGSFGIAWRLLDDIQDIEADMANEIPSSIFVCLSQDMRQCWRTGNGAKKETESGTRAETVFNYILQNKIIERIKARICRELISAAAIADDYHLPGLANEFLCLLKPLDNPQED